MPENTLILASGSPRRRQLLHELLAFLPVTLVVRPKEVNEKVPLAIHVTEAAAYLSKIKAEVQADTLLKGELLLAADTTVIIDDELLAKPADAAEAKAMLLRLSGREHVVQTGYTFAWQKGTETAAAETKVRFNQLSESEIDFYINNYKPFDKAGSYGIQEWIGLAGISKIEGNYFTVVGLPVEPVYSFIKTFFGLMKS